jgi:putative endonuclease
MWHLYMIRCADDTLYTGITTDVERRFGEHADGGPKAAKYVRGRGPLELVAHVEVGPRRQAAQLECRIKALSRIEKERLLEGADGIEELLEAL